jgi:hypothetical protein
MKNFLFSCIFLFLLPQEMFSQHFGFGAAVGGCWPQYFNGRFGNFAPPYHHISHFQPEVYLDGIHKHNETPLLVGLFDEDEISVSWCSWTDSTRAELLSQSAGYVDVLTLKKTSFVNYHFGQSLLIPYSFNDLLEFYVGYAIAFPQTKTLIYLPEKTPSFPYTAADFDKLETKKGGAGIEVVFKARYELPYFYVTTQFSYLFVPELFNDHEWRRNLNIGIQYFFGKNK